jgi:putative SOS response-associated peptidase YedK
MPVVLSPEAYAVWLDPAMEEGAAVTALANDASLTDFEAYPVSTYVNAPRNQGEECIKRLPERP